jgi:deoxyxylulose-5-phosphate synthase
MSYSTAQMRSFSQAGRSWRHCLDAAHLLKRYGYDVTAVSVARLNPLDEDFLLDLVGKFRVLQTFEESIRRGGLYS